VLALAGLLLYAIGTLRDHDLRVWRTMSVPLAIGCLLIALAALNGYGAIGALVTALAAVAWLMSAARRT
jgi:hypothetical protein